MPCAMRAPLTSAARSPPPERRMSTTPPVPHPSDSDRCERAREHSTERRNRVLVSKRSAPLSTLAARSCSSNWDPSGAAATSEARTKRAWDQHTPSTLNTVPTRPNARPTASAQAIFDASQKACLCGSCAAGAAVGCPWVAPEHHLNGVHHRTFPLPFRAQSHRRTAC